MTYQELFEQIRKKKSFLCVGLDPDITKMPSLFRGYDQPLLEFNKAIISATHEYAIAYKPNLALYECYGSEGVRELELTLQYIKIHYPEIFVIADAKHSDMGNTSTIYAKAFFDSPSFNYDAITVTPYMGEDSIKPFLEFPGKWTILLSDDLQYIIHTDGGNKENMMYVVGATQIKKLEEIRKIVPNHFLLIPDVGVQGRSLEEVAKYGMNDHCGLIINSSHDIIYAGQGPRFWEAVKDVAWKKYQQPMQALLREKGLL